MRKAVPVLGVLLILVLFQTLPVETHADGGGGGEEPDVTQLEASIPFPPKPRYTELDSQLNEMADQVDYVSSQGSPWLATAYETASATVTLRLSGNSSSTVELLESGGATVANIGADFIEAEVPGTLLQALAGQEEVLRVEVIVPPQPDVTSQGTTLHGSPPWNARGFTGSGVKVGIIDAGFKGFAGLMGTELPSSVVARCYTSIFAFTATLSDCGNNEVHGTAVAEAVADVAPGVSLYIADPFTEGQLQDSAAWMVSQGVTIINMSLAWTFDGPGDGTSPYSNSPLNTVNTAVSSGAIWVNSAGNAAQENWYGSYADADADGWIEFASGVEINSVFLLAGETLTAQARWEDSWQNAARDLDLYLYDSPATTLVAASLDSQAGAAGQVPYEVLSFTAPSTGTYRLAIRRFAGAIPAWVQLNSFSGQDLSIAVAATSIGSPAEGASSGMLAVGAANWATPSTIESFSSQGPTTDGRTKPDIVGADRGDSVSYGAGGFSGTSQASPHVAGLAALVLQQLPTSTPAQVASYLKSNALPRDAVPNNTWGFGLAHLPALPPSPPTSVTAVGGIGQATVSWTAPAADGGSPITQYIATSSPGSLSATVNASSLSATVTGLTGGTTYTFTVAARNAVGTSALSAPSNAVTPTTPELIPALSTWGLVALGGAFALLLARQLRRRTTR